MDHDGSPASDPRGRELKRAGKSFGSMTHSELGRDPQTCESSADTVLLRDPFQPVMNRFASHTLKLDQIAIPRGSNFDHFPSRRRVSRACDPCRDQKTKCTGQRPSCQRCRECDITCIYSDNKRERDVKFSYIARELLDAWLADALPRQSADLKSRIQMYENLLLNLHPHLDPQLALQVKDALDGVRSLRHALP